MNAPGVSELYIAARCALLDALDALRDHLHALVLVGAQAIYLYTGEADVAIATHTKDSDLAINPALLESDPLLEEAMIAAGFHLNLERRQPGEWISASGIPVDLLVPEALGGPGRRGARIPTHNKSAARKVHGLEVALLDNEAREITSLEPTRDNRSFELKVAGPSALLIAKLHKLGERQEHETRLEDKDAHDIYRLLRAVDTGTFAEKIPSLLEDDRTADVTRTGLDYLQELFGDAGSLGSGMAGRAEAGVGDPEQVAAAVTALALDLIDSL